MASTRTVPVPRYQCTACQRRFFSVKADGNLRKHDDCVSGRAPIVRDEATVPWTGRCTPAKDIPKCKRPPFPIGATRNQTTLWRGSGWSECWVLEVEAAHGRRVRILTRGGDYIAIRARDGSPIVLTDVEAAQVSERLDERRTYLHTWQEQEKELAAAGLDWRSIQGSVRLVSVEKQKDEYRSQNAPGPAYERLWIAHANLLELMIGGEFVLAGNEVNIGRLLHAAGPECLAYWNACDQAELAHAFLVQFRQEFAIAQPWAWWAHYFVQEEWAGFSRFSQRRMMSYGNARRIPGRSFVRVLAEQYIRPDGPLNVEPVRPIYNQVSLW